jgi:aflatoxin B1 aldehyde reductase
VRFRPETLPTLFGSLLQISFYHTNSLVGPDTNAGARITSLPEYNTVLDHFQAAGYNEVDTARTYVGGKQEAFTREANWKDRGLMIATKLYPSEAGKHRPEVLMENFNTSL